MKVIFKYTSLYSIILVLIVSCTKPATDNNSQNDSIVNHFNDTLAIPQSNPKLAKYKSFADTLDKSDLNAALNAIEQFKLIFKNQNSSLCDSGFVYFQGVMDSIETYQNSKLQNDTIDYSPLWNNQPIPENLKVKQQILIQNGFKLSSTVGMAYIEQDRRFILQKFDSLLTASMKLYLSHIALENEQGFASEGRITISYKQLIDRIVWYEKFIAENQKFVFHTNCLNYKKAYFSYLLSGYENTPLYKDDTKTTISDYYLKAFKYLQITYPHTETAKLTKPYYDALISKNHAALNDIYKDYIIKGLIFNLK